jgi:hypothetical protein
MNVEIGTQAAQFPEKEYINGIFLAVHGLHTLLLSVPQNLRRAVGSTNFPVVGNGLESTTIMATCVADRAVPLYEG